MCFSKSLASWEEKTKQGGLKKDCWATVRNEKLPRQVIRGSGAKFFFQCDVTTCGHIFKSSLDHVVGRGDWCPFCANPPKKLCDAEDCVACFTKSLASWMATTEHGLKKDCWDLGLNKKTPRQVFQQCNAKFFFRCDNKRCGRDFQSSLNMVVGQGCWCPFCASSKGNKALSQSLRNQLSDFIQAGDCKIQSEASFPNCIGSRGQCMRFDFAVVFVDGKVLLIEFDGMQHFEYVAQFHRSVKDLQRQRLHDMMKTKFAIESGATLVRIAYTDLDRVDDWVRVGLQEAARRVVALGVLGHVIFSDHRLYARQSQWERTCPTLKQCWARMMLRRCLTTCIKEWRYRRNSISV